MSWLVSKKFSAEADMDLQHASTAIQSTRRKLAARNSCKSDKVSEGKKEGGPCSEIPS